MTVDPIPYATPVGRPQIEGGRRGGLMAFGVLSILLGALPALAAAALSLTTAQLVFSPFAAQYATTILPILLTAICVNGAVATLFIWGGIASIRCRRWVRPVVLGIGWPTIVTSGLAAVGYLLMSRDFAAMAGNAEGAVPSRVEVAIQFAVMVGLGVVLPAAYVLFYSTQAVRRTLEAYDPRPSWTESSPLPVFVGCTTLFFAGVATLALSLINSVPFFGRYVGGVAAAVLTVSAGVLMIFAAWLMHRGRVLGWWLALGVVTTGFTSAIVTFCTRGMLEFYRHGGLPSGEVESLGRSPTMSGVTPIVFAVVVMAISVGYLLSIRRHFRPRDAMPAGAYPSHA